MAGGADLESILEQLYTNNGRAAFMRKLCKEPLTEREKRELLYQCTFPAEWLRVMEKCAHYGLFDEAAMLAERIGMRDKAVEYYERAENPEGIAGIVKQVNMYFSDARMRRDASDIMRYQKEVEVYEKVHENTKRKRDERFKHVALDERLNPILCEEAKRREKKFKYDAREGKRKWMSRAAQLFMAVKMTSTAHGLCRKLIEEHENVGEYRLAAEVAIEAGMVEEYRPLIHKALEHYEWKGNFEGATTFARKAGMTEREQLYNRIVEILNST